MGIKFGGSPRVQNESIVQTNLVLQLDAGYNGSLSDPSSSTITDLTGNNNGTIVGNTLFTRRNGGGIWIPRGTSSYITTDTTKTDFTTSNEISIGYWFTPQAYTASNYGFLCFGDSVNDLTNWIGFQNSTSGSGFIRFYINNGARFDNVPVTLGTPIYIALTYSSNLWTLYTNGEQFNTYTGGIGSTAAPRLYLGGGSTGGTEDMIFHHIHIYDDLLSADEVTKNYNILRYRFNN